MRTPEQQRARALLERRARIDELMPGTGDWIRQAVTCLDCGALVAAVAKNRHYDWHQREAAAQRERAVLQLGRRETVVMHETLVALFG